jgi:hypothetical protein
VQGLFRASGIVDDSRHHAARRPAFFAGVGIVPKEKMLDLFLREIGQPKM